VETGTLEFYNPQLVNVVSPTIADRRWMENMVKVVNDTWNQNGKQEGIYSMSSLAITAICV
jgi:hypothetical protein